MHIRIIPLYADVTPKRLGQRSQRVRQSSPSLNVRHALPPTLDIHKRWRHKHILFDVRSLTELLKRW